MTREQMAQQARDYATKAREQEPAELRAILDWGRQQNAKRYEVVNGLVQFRGDVPVKKA